MDTTDSSRSRRRSVSATSASVSVIVGAVLAEPERVITEHEIGRHHLRDAGNRSRMLVRADPDLGLSCLDERGLAICRPHGAGRRLPERATALTAKDVDG
jgi:hypothetical protein